MRQINKTIGCRVYVEVHGTDCDDGNCDDETGGPYLACIHGQGAWGKTAPEAICKAALIAVMESEE